LIAPARVSIAGGRSWYRTLFVASLLMEFALLGRVHMNVMVQISVPVVRQSFVFLMSVAHSHHSGYAWECKA